MSQEVDRAELPAPPARQKQRKVPICSNSDGRPLRPFSLESLLKKRVDGIVVTARRVNIRRAIHVGPPSMRVLYAVSHAEETVQRCTSASVCTARRSTISTLLAGQRRGITEVDEGIWLVSFMTYGPGYIDLEQTTLQTIDNPLGTRLSPVS